MWDVKEWNSWLCVAKRTRVLLKYVDSGKPKGRLLGKPKCRWWNQVIPDTTHIGTSVEVAVDRNRWRMFVDMTGHGREFKLKIIPSFSRSFYFVITLWSIKFTQPLYRTIYRTKNMITLPILLFKQYEIKSINLFSLTNF